MEGIISICIFAFMILRSNRKEVVSGIVIMQEFSEREVLLGFFSSVVLENGFEASSLVPGVADSVVFAFLCSAKRCWLANTKGYLQSATAGQAP